jgi:3',5'-cyclic AMP phosphodiesterase CpdA
MKKLYEEAAVQDIAAAIREKTGGAETYKIAQMGDAVRGITTGDLIAHADIPDYIKAAALEVAKKVQAVRTADSIVFVAASDAHQLDTSADIVNGNLHAGMAMKALAYILPGIDFACYLGDYTAGSATTTLTEGRQHFAEINANIDEAFSGIPQFRTLGNHDSLQYSKAMNGSVLSAAELYGLCGAYNTGAVMGSTTEGYCYRDFEDKKLRVICLNTAENSEKEYVSDEQKLWFANVLKAVGAKTGWNVLILSHHPLDWGGVCILSNIVKAYVDGSSITVSSGNTINFSGSNSATILAAIHGHVHCFKAAKLSSIANNVGTEYNVWRIATPNMCFARNNEYGANGNAEYYGIEFGETITYAKTADSAKDTAFVVNVINPSQQKIYSYCYGAGYDREIFTGIQTVAVTGVSLNAASGELIVGGQTTLTATVAPEDASNKTVTWTSSAPTVASVANGVVTAHAPGSAKITVKTVDGNFTAEYALTVKAAVIDLVATNGYIDDTRVSTATGIEKAGAGYVTIGHTAAIPIDRVRYPNGAIIRVTGAVNCLGNNWSGAGNGGDSAWVLYAGDGTQYSVGGYIENKVHVAGTITVDADKTGFTLDIASLSAPHNLKFCVKGTGANLTATLTPK